MNSVAVAVVGEMARGLGQMANSQERETEIKWFEGERAFRENATRWRGEDVRFKNIVKVWRAVESKRSRMTQVADQLESLARLASYMCIAELTVYINQGLPGSDEGRLSPGLLGLWGAMCVCSVVVLIVIIFVATVLHLNILEVSIREGNEERTPDDQQYSLTNPEGEVMSPFQFHTLWSDEYDTWFRLLVRAFSVSVALFFTILAPLGHVKFHVSQPAAWAFTAVCVAALVLWFRYHTSMISYLLFRSPRDPPLHRSRPPPSPPAPPAPPAPPPPPHHGDSARHLEEPREGEGSPLRPVPQGSHLRPVPHSHEEGVGAVGVSPGEGADTLGRQRSDLARIKGYGAQAGMRALGNLRTDPRVGKESPRGRAGWSFWAGSPRGTRLPAEAEHQGKVQASPGGTGERKSAAVESPAGLAGGSPIEALDSPTTLAAESPISLAKEIPMALEEKSLSTARLSSASALTATSFESAGSQWDDDEEEA